jgi:polyhydroxyalkanoate synthesis regulator phasin
MASKSGKDRVRQAFYMGPTSGETRAPQGDTNVLETRFTNGSKVKHSLNDLKPEMRNVLSYFGLNKKFSDSMAKEGGISVDDAIEVIDEVWDSLKRGVWREPTERGPNIGLIIQAIFRAKNEKGTPEREAKLSKQLADAEQRLGAMNNPAIKAAYTAIMAERAQARAQEAATAAKTAGKVDLTTF